MKSIAHVLTYAGLWVVVFAGAARGQETDLLLAAQLSTLDDPIVVQTKRGQDFAGQVETFSDATVVLAAQVGDGEVIYSFKEAEILRVRFPGNELKEVALEYAEVGEFEAALTLIDKLFDQRFPLFPLAGEAEVGYFAQTLPVYRAAGELAKAYERVEALRPFLHDASATRLLEAEQLLLAWQLERKEEVKRLAHAWIAAEGREVRNALGSCLLGLSLFEEGRVEEAFQTVLFPLQFSRGRTIPYLDNCYTIALELARFLGQDATGAALSREIERRGVATTLEWNDFSPPDYSRLNLPRPNL